MTTPSETWDSSYATSTSPPWDIGRPQPAFVRLADTGLLSGRLLDAGCGTGEQTLLAASKGANALGIDISPRAIQRARDKAAERGIAARFEVADALNLWQFGLAFDTVIDSGVFHIFDDEDRVRYVASLASVVEPGGSLYLICFSDTSPAPPARAGSARTSCAPRSATAGMSTRSSRRSSRSTRNPGSAPRPWRPGWPPSPAVTGRGRGGPRPVGSAG